MKIKNASQRLWMRRWRRQKRQESCAKTTQPTPAPPAGTQMVVPRGVAAYPSFPERRFPTNMSATTMMTKNRVKSHKGHSAKYTPHTPAPPNGRQIIVPRGITTYQSLPDRQFPMTMRAATMTTNKRRKSHKGNSTHARSSFQEADGSAQRDNDRPIHYQKVIPNDYDCNDDDDE